MRTMPKIVAGALVIVVLLSIPFLAGCASPQPSAQPIALTYSNFFPPTHLNSILAEEWIKEVEKRTNGAVKITYYPGGTLTAAAKIYDGVVQGISDIGMSAMAYTMGRFPVSELLDLPHSYPNAWVATKTINDYYQKFKPAEFNDVQVMYFHGHGPGVIFTTKKPVRTLEDMKGLVIRATGVGTKIVEALGAKGYGAAQGEVYELLSKAVIDGSYTPPEVLKGWKQAEVVKYVTACYDVGNTTGMFVVINKNKFNSLPKNVQKAMTDVSAEWIEKHGMVWDYYDQEALAFFKTFEGREVIELSKDEMARWVNTSVTPLLDTYQKEKSAMGLPTADFEKYIKERVAYWKGKSPTSAQSVDWVKKNLEPLMKK